MVSPLAMARAMNNKVSAIETRLEIVIVKRSEKAAKTIKAGKNKSVAISSMVFKIPYPFSRGSSFASQARLRQIEKRRMVVKRPDGGQEPLTKSIGKRPIEFGRNSRAD